MSDTLSILRHSSSLLAKTWQADGSVTPYGDAKYFTLQQQAVANLPELSLLLSRMEKQPRHCLIRGAYVGEEQAQARDGDGFQGGKVRRALAYFGDQPLHSALIDIDGFEPLGADALTDPLAAIEEFISTELPAAFHSAGYHWQLSNSAGHQSKGSALHAHLWFWLATPLTSAQLRGWAKATKLAADLALFNPVQVHYTSAPQFESGTTNPYPHRSGYVAGLAEDAVYVDIAPELLAAEGAAYALERPRLAADAVADDVVTYLYAQALVLGADMEGRLHVECPNFAEHTSDGVESATSYFPAGVGREGAGFKCLHAHCTDLHLGWFLRAIGFDKPEDDFNTVEAAALVDPARVLRDAILVNFYADILAATDVRDLEETIALRVAANQNLTDTDRNLIALRMRDRCKALGAAIGVVAIRGWIRPKFDSTYPHVTDDGALLGTLENMKVLLRTLGVTVRYNVIKKMMEILIPDTSFTRDNRDNASIARIISECERVRMPSRHCQTFLLALADENQYNPVLTWIESKPWDGESRLESFYATVQTPAAVSGIKASLMRKWLVQCAAAACLPDGIAAQGVLVFVGAQNVGKTTWFQNLAPAALDVVLTGHSLDTRNKDSVFTAVGHWIVELGELDGTFKKSDIAALKAFITQPVDKIRRPYAIAESQMARRTVLGASVNEPDFLSDPTGNRRFWTVPTEGFMHNHGVDMQQLWAEVLLLAQAGEGWSLSRTEIAELSDHNEGFTAADPWVERVTTTFAWNDPSAAWQEVTATQVSVLCGASNVSAGECRRISAAVKRLNGGQVRKSNGVQLLRVPTEGGWQ